MINTHVSCVMDMRLNLLHDILRVLHTTIQVLPLTSSNGYQICDHLIGVRLYTDHTDIIRRFEAMIFFGVDVPCNGRG